MRASTQQLTVNPSYSALVHPLSHGEYLDLKKSMAENGQYIPIIVNESGVILDGHHRLRICRELSIKPKITTKHFENQLLEQLFVIDSNLKRRHMNDYQKGILTLKKKPIYEEIAKRNMMTGVKVDPIQKFAKGVNGKLGNEVGLSHETIRKVQIIEQNASAEDKEKLNRGQKTINKIFRKIEKEEKRQELMTQRVMSLPKQVKLIHGDFRVKTKMISDESVDLLFVDPLYDKKSVQLYGEISKVAARVLKSGGSLVMYASQYHLPQVIESLNSVKDLKYWWMFCEYPYRSLVHRRQVYSYWKPLLWYVRGGNKPRYSSDSLSDMIHSSQPDKLYRYQQSVETASYIINQLTVEGDLVFDPCMGSSSSGVAALMNKRRYVGIEQDQSVFELAKRRISKYVDY